ncbi:hypothetical protein MGH68_07095 [Erysipelothrix sp. D19-032]
MKKIIKIATNEVVTIEGSTLTIEQVESEKDITKLNDGIFKTDERILILHGGIEILHLSDSGIHIKPMPAITKENTTTENSDVIKRKIVIENKVNL